MCVLHFLLGTAAKFHDPLTSPNYSVIDDTDIKAIVKDHLSVNNTVVVSWDDHGKPVVRGSKTEGTLSDCVLCIPLCRVGQRRG